MVEDLRNYIVSRRPTQLTDIWDKILEIKYNSNLEQFVQNYLIPGIFGLSDLEDRERQIIKAISHYKEHPNPRYRNLVDLLNTAIELRNKQSSPI